MMMMYLFIVFIDGRGHPASCTKNIKQQNKIMIKRWIKMKVISRFSIFFGIANCC